MKKKLALLLACTMALGLTACGGSKPAAAPETTAAATEAAAESSEESKADEHGGKGFEFAMSVRVVAVFFFR